MGHVKLNVRVEFSSDELADLDYVKAYLGVVNYTEVVRAAVKELARRIRKDAVSEK